MWGTLFLRLTIQKIAQNYCYIKRGKDCIAAIPTGSAS